MVNKTKNVKKKRYIKRQSRKRIYGGDNTEERNSSSPPIISKENDNNLLQVNPPSTLDNLKTGANIGLQLGNNVMATSLGYVEDGVENMVKSIGIDPNANVKEEVSKIADKAEKWTNALNSPEGKKALKNLGNIATEFSKEVIGPGITKVVDVAVENSGPILDKGAKAVLDGLGATPFGPIIEAPRFVADVAGIVQTSTGMVSDILDVGEHTINKGKEETNKLKSAWSDFKSVMNKGNEYISSGLNNVQSMVDKSGKKIIEEGIQNGVKVQSTDDSRDYYRTHGYGQSGGSLKKFQRDAIMIGGRTNKSKLEFLSPYVNSSQILQQYGGKLRTTRRNKVRHRLTSRRR